MDWTKAQVKAAFCPMCRFNDPRICQPDCIGGDEAVDKIDSLYTAIHEAEIAGWKAANEGLRQALKASEAELEKAIEVAQLATSERDSVVAELVEVKGAIRIPGVTIRPADDKAILPNFALEGVGICQLLCRSQPCPRVCGNAIALLLEKQSHYTLARQIREGK